MTGTGRGILLALCQSRVRPRYAASIRHSFGACQIEHNAYGSDWPPSSRMPSLLSSLHPARTYSTGKGDPFFYVLNLPFPSLVLLYYSTRIPEMQRQAASSFVSFATRCSLYNDPPLCCEGGSTCACLHASHHPPSPIASDRWEPWACSRGRMHESAGQMSQALEDATVAISNRVVVQRRVR